MKQPKPYPNDELNEPEDELTVLRRENKMFKEDAMYALFFALNRKNNEIAASLNSFTLDLKSDDKSFERFVTLQKGLDDMVKTLASLRTDYLKLPEDEVDAASKKPIPNILEQHANKKK